MPGTDISYPVMLGASNETYLRHTFDKSYLLSGSIFMDFRNSPDYSNFNTIIFGHNMRDGSMFSELGRYLDESFLAENNTVYLHTLDGMLTYRILAAQKTDIDNMMYQIIDPSDAEIKSFVTELGDAGSAYTPGDRFLTLSTCSDGQDEDARTLLTAILES